MQICFAFRDLRAVAKALERWTNSNSISSCKNLKQAQNFCHLLCAQTLSFFSAINFGTFLDVSHLWINSYFQVRIFSWIPWWVFLFHRQGNNLFPFIPTQLASQPGPNSNISSNQKRRRWRKFQGFLHFLKTPRKMPRFSHFVKTPSLRWHNFFFWNKETISSWDINFWQQMSRRSELSCWNFDILDTSWEIESQMFWLGTWT